MEHFENCFITTTKKIKFCQQHLGLIGYANKKLQNRKGALNMDALSKEFTKKNLKFDHPSICSGTWGRNCPKDSRKTTLKVEYPFVTYSCIIPYARYATNEYLSKSFGPPCGIITSKDGI